MVASNALRPASLALLALAACASPRSLSPRSGPARVSFETERVSVGGAALSPTAVTFERGRGATQNWFFAARPSSQGDLRVRVSVTGARFEGERDDGLLFAAGDAARVLYSHGTWIDADGARTPVRARHAQGAIELVVPSSVLARSRFPAMLDPDILPLNGDAHLDSTVTGVDVAYPSFANATDTASIALALDRGPLNPTVRVLSVDVARRATSFERTYFSQDAVGLASVAAPVETFALASRASLPGGAWGNLLLSWYPVSASAPALGFAPNDLPEFSCSALGVCAFSYARMETPSFAVRRVTLARGMSSAIAASSNTLIGVGEAPALGEHDVAVLRDTVVAASSRLDAGTALAVTEVARIPASMGAGTWMGRWLTGAGATRPRLACGEIECALVVATAPNVLAIARFGAATVAGPLTLTPFTLHSFMEVITTHDVAVIDGGYRVAYLVRGTSRTRLMVADLLASDGAPASLGEFALPTVAARNVRIASASGSRVSIVTWSENVSTAATAHGALVLETPDASAPDSATPADAAIVDVFEPADAAVDATVMPDASPADAITSDAITSDAITSDAITSDASSDAEASRPPQYGGGACACSVTTPRGPGPIVRWAAGALLAVWASARRKRAR